MGLIGPKTQISAKKLSHREYCSFMIFSRDKMNNLLQKFGYPSFEQLPKQSQKKLSSPLISNNELYLVETKSDGKCFLAFLHLSDNMLLSNQLNFSLGQPPAKIIGEINALPINNALDQHMQNKISEDAFRHTLTINHRYGLWSHIDISSIISNSVLASGSLIIGNCIIKDSVVLGSKLENTNISGAFVGPLSQVNVSPYYDLTNGLFLLDNSDFLRYV